MLPIPLSSPNGTGQTSAPGSPVRRSVCPVSLIDLGKALSTLRGLPACVYLDSGKYRSTQTGQAPTDTNEEMAKKKKATRKETDERPSFEEALKELEETVRQLEDGQLGLDESLARYEEGVKYLERCHELLRRAERKVELLSGVDAEGNPITKPYEDEDLSLDDKASSRGKRRSSTQATANQDDRDEVDDPSRLF